MQGELIAGRYRLDRHLGGGAMGVVWQGHDQRLQRTVAIKQLLVGRAVSVEHAAEARERAMREARLAARLTHPNAVSVYDALIERDDPWLIMEYVPSRSLAAVILDRGPLDPAEVTAIGSRVTDALIAAHEAGIVHRDVKPGNVLLAEDGSVKLTDFGVAHAVDDVTVTAPGQVAGTPAYMAPELITREPVAPGADVFSLGCTLYAAVEGRPPFHGQTDVEIVRAVVAGNSTPPRRAGHLTALLMWMLRTDSQARPSMAEVQQSLGGPALARTGGDTAVYPHPSGPAEPEPQHPARTTRDERQAQAAPRASRSPRNAGQFGQPGQSGQPGAASRMGPSAGAWNARRVLFTALAVTIAAVFGILVTEAFFL